jgi:6-phosphogluconolactonase
MASASPTQRAGAGKPTATFVYVSNGDDGVISTYRMQDSGELQPGIRVKSARGNVPLATSPDGRFLYAASRFEPFTAHVYAIDPGTGALTPLSTSPLAESFPYISLDSTGRFLLCASYSGHVVSVNAVGADGTVAAPPLQVLRTGLNAHAVHVDATNRFAFVPALGSDAICLFRFDARTGLLSANTPATQPMKPMTGPRHFVLSGDNRFLYVLGEMAGTVTTFAVDGGTGLLTEMSSVSGLSPSSPLVPGIPRVNPPARNVDNDIWAADIHMTPNGRFLYVSERTASTLNAFAVDGATGVLSYRSSTPTERQPRGFAIDPQGRYLIAAGEKSETISVYAIDPSSGALGLLDRYATGKGANWVEIVSFT